MPRRAKTGIFAPSRINQKPMAAANCGLAAIYDGNDGERSQCFDSESHFELADREDRYTKH